MKSFYPEDLSSLHELAVASTMNAAVNALMCTKGLISLDDVSDKVTKKLCHEFSTIDDGSLPEKISASLECLRGIALKVNKRGDLIITTSPEQRQKGVYFTPVELAIAMLRPALEEKLKNVNSIESLRKVAMLDPAAGCGAFLITALRITVEVLSGRQEFAMYGNIELMREVADHCIYGVDIDPVAIATTHALIVAEVGDPDWEARQLDKHLKVGDSISVSIETWEKWFPDRAAYGFELIVTNPPWSKLRPLKHEFFEHIDANVRRLQGTALGVYLERNMNSLIHEEWGKYVDRTMVLSNRLRASQEYIVNKKSSGDPDLYKFFTERSVRLLAYDGVAALLLPSGILRAQGSTPLRQLLFESGEVAEVTEYINKNKIFDIHSMYRFTSLLFIKGKGFRGVLGKFASTLVNEINEKPRVFLDSNFLNAVGGLNKLIPEVRDKEEKAILEKLYRGGNFSDAFGGFVFKRELDMTNDSSNFVEAKDAICQGFKQESDGRWVSDRANEILLPVYEGRMVHQYDHKAKYYLEGQGRSAKWSVPMPGKGVIMPHYFVNEAYALKRGWRPKPRAGFCEISGHANERTILGALIPSNAICGNKVPVLKSSSLDDHFLWLAFANSLVIDWVMRRWVSTTINQFYWRNIPFPAVLSTSDRNFLIHSSQALCDLNNIEFSSRYWLGKRSQLRIAIDSVVFNLFGITSVERRKMLEDFDIFIKSEKKGGERSKDILALLDIYATEHLKGELTVEKVDKISSPEKCLAAYANKKHIEMLVS
ncbi:N-6 DNA methylase [Halomonas sp. Bachu 37]|uniref:Eco57I restriction-modification methylase domain-containing protein n=1 Tax=Halomonas kashgarensis TaxID=3084920 RepID=UPI003217A1CC